MNAEKGSQPGEGYSTPVAPVGGPSGRRVPRSGWIALTMLAVAGASFLAGVQIAGAPRATLPTSGGPSPGLVAATPSPSPTASPSATPSKAPTSSPAVLPPVSSLSLERALAAARTAFLGTSPQIVSAMVARYGDVSGSGLVSPDTWVWVFTARGTFPSASCGGLTATPHPCPSAATTARVIVDIETGAFIEANVPALP